MKKLLLFFAFVIALSNTTFAQKKKGVPEIDPPKAVDDAFQKKYKLAKKPFWSEDEGNFRVDFKYNDATMAACYAEDGKMLYTEKELSKAQHNKAAVKYILENYAGFKILNMRKRDTYDKKTTYITMLRKAKELLEVEFDKKGGFIRDTDKTPVTASKKKKKDEDEENTDEEKPAKNTKAKKGKKTEEDADDEEATPAAKPEKAKPAPKKTDDDEEDAKPAAKTEKAKPAPKKTSDDDDEEDVKTPPKKQTTAKPETKKKTSDDDDEEDVKTPPKKETKAKPAPKKEKKKKSDEDEDDDE